MTRKLLLAGNWKMNKLNSELAGFFEAFAKESGLAADSDVARKIDILFAAPFTLLDTALQLAAPLGIKIAAQNAHWEPAGAYTGEVSMPMLRELGIASTLIGHSERRQYFGETDATVAKKTKAALAQGLLPIVCVGETLEEREAGKTEAVVARQVEAFTSAVDDPGPMVIAYEPVWAIGTGRSATSAQAQEVHAFIRGLLTKPYGRETAEAMRILYGGSASPANIDELLQQKDIDGGLVGGAALKPADFAKMVVSALKARR